MSKDEKVWALKNEIRDYQTNLAYYQNLIHETESMLVSAQEDLTELEKEEFKDD